MSRADTTQSEPYSIGATPYDFEGKNLTAYGELLPVATMLERLGFQQLIEETLTVKRFTRAMSMYQFVLAMVLAVYMGFSWLHHLRFVTREPMLYRLSDVADLGPQDRFLSVLTANHFRRERLFGKITETFEKHTRVLADRDLAWSWKR